MVHCTESDATYCSDLEKEKEELSQVRRSKRLSQQHPSTFRSTVDQNSQRLDEIYRLLQSEKFCSTQSKNDWLAFKFEVDTLRKPLNAKSRSKFSFISKKINQHLSQQTKSKKIKKIPGQHEDVESNKSPNILAGMTTDVLTELPPYQPQNLINIMKETTQCSNNMLTQVNPLDLTKKLQTNNGFLIQTDINNYEPQIRSSQKKVSNISKDSLIDLTDGTLNEENLENEDPLLIEETLKANNTVHISKWFQYLSSQERPKIYDEEHHVTLPSTKKSSKSFKQSIRNIHSEEVQLIRNIPDKTKKPKITLSKYYNGSKSRQPSTTSRSETFRKTKNISILKDPEMLYISHHKAQTERLSSLSPNLFFQELPGQDVPALDDNESIPSLSFSLKDDFKKVFGTDTLDKVFGCEEVIYSLNEIQVKQLANTLKIKHKTLKKAIEEVVRSDDFGIFGDDKRSDSSVVACSQSPPQRLFPSQRSQVSK